ncbi:MAG: hypothetical protein ACLFV7_04725 [Phycisphaerae bacterium]
MHRSLHASLAVLTLAAVCSAETPSRSFTLPVARDVGICAHPREVTLNTGGNPRVRVKGNEHYYLFDVDRDKLPPMHVSSATLKLKLAKGGFHKLALSTVAAQWVEGTAVNKPQKGSACFTHRRYPELAWTPHGGTFLQATFNNPRMVWKSADFRRAAEGWVIVDIPPALAQALVDGTTHGLVLAEEAGQTRQNHDIYTRRQKNAAPALTITGKVLDRQAGPVRRPMHAASPDPNYATLRTGAIRVAPSWVRTDAKNGKPHPPGDSHEISVFDPAGGRLLRKVMTFHSGPVTVAGLPPGRKVTVGIRTFLNGRVHEPARPVGVTVSDARQRPRVPRPVERKAFPAVATCKGWRGEWHRVHDLVDPSAGSDHPDDARLRRPLTPRGAWVSFQWVVTWPDGRARNVSPGVKVTHSGIQPDRPLPVRVYRAWSVAAGKKQVPDVLVPVDAGETVDLPWKKNGLQNQRNQTFVIDVWVPEDAETGAYGLSAELTDDGRTLLQASAGFDVAAPVLPGEFHVAGDMNTYSSPASAMGLRPSDPAAFFEMERKYYRLAHAHRMTLSVLPYSQAGESHWRSAPALEKQKDGSLRVAGFEQWDRRYGPLLSGEAFGGSTGYVGPGSGRPIRHMYLPLHENWPARLSDHFRPWPPPKDYDRFLLWTAKLPRPERSLAGGQGARPYERSFKQVLGQFVEHLRRRNRTDTRMQVYLNNKYYFRRPRQNGRPGRGVSLWLLDEPMHADDFRALRMFASWTRDVTAEAEDVPVDFRIDISRPTHQRDWFDGPRGQRLVDLNVCADQLYDQRRLLRRRRVEFGERYWNYRMPGSFGASNDGWSLWPVRSYCWGALGTLPWQTIASDGDLQKADATALMYPGRKFGLSRPLPSLRMKAWREGLQTAELLHALARKENWSPLQTRAFVAEVCGWKEKSLFDPPPGSKVVSFRGCDLSDVLAAAVRKLSKDGRLKTRRFRGRGCLRHPCSGEQR